MRAEYIDHMGDDLAIVNAAKVSFSKESKELGHDEVRLIKYLAKHNHWTPYAHTAIKLRMKAPVPIRTQCFKHKEGFVENEESRRYISSTPDVFVPESFRSKPDGSIKQGSGGVHHASDGWLGAYGRVTDYLLDMYTKMIDDGVCPEQARFILPQGCEVSWIWTGNLASFARFYNLRTDPHAQKEIQDLAKEVGEIISQLFPVGWAALTQKEK